jgi:hypothetical protein
MTDIRRKFSEQSGDANLEEIFFRATSENETAVPPVVSPPAPPPLPGPH